LTFQGGQFENLLPVVSQNELELRASGKSVVSVHEIAAACDEPMTIASAGRMASNAGYPRIRLERGRMTAYDISAETKP
jgi:hypothetical protein